MPTPPIPPKIYRTVVEFVRDDTPTVYTIRLRLVDGPFTFAAGQYVMVRYLHHGKIVNKPYSIASAPHETGYVDLCIKRIKDGYTSNYLYNLKPGDGVEILAPLGVFTLRESSKDILFIAGGSGIGPIRSMLHHLLSQQSERQLWLFFGNRIREEIIYHEEFLQLALRHPNFHYHPVLSREDWTGERGYVQDAIRKHISDFANCEAYICGLPDLVEHNKALLLGKGMDKHEVHHEVYV